MCNFLHENVRKKARVCSFYQSKGFCKKGRGCDFLHDDEVKETSSRDRGQERDRTRELISSSSSEKKIPKEKLSESDLDTSSGVDNKELEPLEKNENKLNREEEKTEENQDQSLDTEIKKKEHEETEGRSPTQKDTNDTKHTTTTTTTTSSTASASSSSDSVLDRDSICAYFNSKFGCKKGDICDFKHEKTQIPMQPPPQAPVDKVCDFWTTNQGCRKGSLCNFLHPGFLGVQNSKAIRDNKVCAYYTSPRGCVKGTGCDFLHVQPTSVYNATTPNHSQNSYLAQDPGSSSSNNHNYQHSNNSNIGYYAPQFYPNQYPR